MKKKWNKPQVNVLGVSKTADFVNLLSNKPTENPGCTSDCKPGTGYINPNCPVHNKKHS